LKSFEIKLRSLDIKGKRDIKGKVEDPSEEREKGKGAGLHFAGGISGPAELKHFRAERTIGFLSPNICIYTYIYMSKQTLPVFQSIPSSSTNPCSPSQVLLPNSREGPAADDAAIHPMFQCGLPVVFHSTIWHIHGRAQGGCQPTLPAGPCHYASLVLHFGHRL
jgi:hypothetical protein